ncbi:UNVERIFIED_CONTAM: Peptidyl-prolyl cis-trans isomerase fpr2 [Siphonaria sp. JEL0065]|nr:Peptidyl-prolyl cis-trans isomerase fpr2 [Siphonaria sp. JEL0065]
MQSILRLACLLLSIMIVSANVQSEGRTPPIDLEITTKVAIPAEKCTQKAQLGDIVAVKYRANIWKQDKIFDQSGNKYPFEFMVGRRDMNIPKGLQEGLVGACVGETRHLLMPPEYGFMPDPVYGYSSAPKAPYGSFLEYNVQLVKLVSGGKEYVIAKEHEIERDEL